MFKVQILNKISALGLSHFSPVHYTLGNDLTSPDAILVRSQNMHELVLPSSLKIVGRAGAGVNNIPVAKLTQAGIPVLNTPGANANAVKELVLAGMLLASRNICQGWNYVQHLQGTSTALHQQVERDKKQFVGYELIGKTFGIIGLGAVGVKIANVAVALEMHTIGYDPAITVQRAWELSSRVRQVHSIDELLLQADFISLHVPYTPATHHLINAERIALLKPTAVLLNFAREPIVDHTALLASLNQHARFIYVNDFPLPMLKNHPQVISLPHLGASTQEAETNCAVMIAKQISDFLEQGTIINSVNFPTVAMPYTAGTRLVVINANIPNMVAQISAVLAAANLNIIDLVNKSRDNIAYTLIDVDALAIEPATLAKITAIEGVIQARQLVCQTYQRQ